MAIKKPTKTCVQCNLTTVSIDKNFYATKNNYYFPDGRISVCKQCLYKKWEEEGFDSFLETMQMIDKPVFEDKFEMAGGNYKKYVTQISSLTWGKDKTFIDSTLFSAPKFMSKRKEEERENELILKELTLEEYKELQEYWGAGKEEDEYIWLTAEFSRYIQDPSKVTPTFEDIIQEMCLNRLDMRKKRDAGQDISKESKLFTDLMTAAGIKPTQENGTGNAELDAFSKLIDKLENTRPVSDPDPKWKDKDGIRNMLVSFFLHPWARLWNKEKESPYYEEAKKTLDKFTVKPIDYDNIGSDNSDDNEQ